MKLFYRFYTASLLCVLAIAGCSSAGSTPSSTPAAAGVAQVRYVDGAPFLETLINGVPTDIGAAYLQVNGQSVASSFAYGTMTSFMPVSAGTQSLVARDTVGYAVGPLKSSALSAGGRYTLAVVGSYPDYQVLTFTEPSGSGAQLSLYEASPTVPSIDFGSFKASTGSGFAKLGSAQLGTVSTVALGKSVSDLGAYAGTGNTPIANGALTLAQINSFDTHNVLPFHNAGRASLFLFDSKPGSTKGPVFGSLDK